MSHRLATFVRIRARKHFCVDSPSWRIILAFKLIPFSFLFFFSLIILLKANERVVIDFKVNGERPPFVPDGMTIDAEGSLYIATFGGNTIYKVHPKSGKVLLEIKIPAEQVTSAAFGGPNLDILYVTTAGKEFSSPQPPPAGALFKVTGLGVKGTKMTSVKLN